MYEALFSLNTRDSRSNLTARNAVPRNCNERKKMGVLLGMEGPRFLLQACVAQGVTQTGHSKQTLP